MIRYNKPSYGEWALIDESGNLMPAAPFPGHDAVYASVQSASRSRLDRVMANAVAATDTFLYDICQQDQSGIGSPNLENLRLFRSVSQAIEHQYSRALDAGFAAFRRKLKSSGEAPAADLSLVDLDDMDDVVNAELVTEAVMRSCSDVINATGQRFCALLGLPSAEKASSPLSERKLAEYLRGALAGVQLPTKIRFMLFRNYESALIAALSALLEDANEPMIKAGVLPHLATPRPARRPEPPKPEAPKPEAPVVAERSAHSERAPVPPQAAAVTQQQRELGELSDLPIGSAEQALFLEICDYLHNWRPQHERAAAAQQSLPLDGSAPASGVRHRLSKNETIALLSSMQRILPEAVSAAMSASDASLSSCLKDAMLGSTRKIGLAPDAVEIDREDEDAVDLVGMLFDVLITERDFREEARRLMSRLVVPYAKAAVLDRRLFLTKAHPARRLLNALAEAIEGNQGDGPQERELLGKAEATVDSLVAGFNEDIAIFETLEQEMRAYLDQHRRRVDMAEKRAKEAQRGQERLENARMLAARELEARTGNAELPSVIQDFFSRYWTHHLSMIILREGEDSGAWSVALKLADDLISVLGWQPPEARIAAVQQLRLGIEAVLSSSGVLSDSSSALIQKIAESAAHYHAPVKPAGEPAVTAQKAAAGGLHMAFNKSALDFDPRDVEYFKNLPVGAWLQMAVGNGGFAPIKLAWISPISARLMFVNRRGVRVLVVSVEELAEMKKHGKLIVHAEENVFEQTLDRVLQRLKADFS